MGCTGIRRQPYSLSQLAISIASLLSEHRPPALSVVTVALRESARSGTTNPCGGLESTNFSPASHCTAAAALRVRCRCRFHLRRNRRAALGAAVFAGAQIKVAFRTAAASDARHGARTLPLSVVVFKAIEE